MGFEVFEKTSAPLAKVPTVTIQTRGLISLNRSAHALLDKAEAVELLWDAERKMVGLRTADVSSPNAYPVRPQNQKSQTGPLLIAGSAFTKYYGIDTTVARRWVPSLDDGILCIDLQQDGQRVVSNRSRASETGDESD
ncbi:hypothetical protein [Promicromonospora soli]